jgi:hypothetical protein
MDIECSVAKDSQQILKYNLQLMQALAELNPQRQQFLSNSLKALTTAGEN